jgi:hypothetical protein
MRTPLSSPALVWKREGWETTPQVRLGLGPGELKEPEGGPAPSEANEDPPPNPHWRLTRLFTQKEGNENFKELIWVVGCIILPTGLTKDQQTQVNCGSTASFRSLKLVQMLNLEILPLKNGSVSLGEDTKAQAGELRGRVQCSFSGIPRCDLLVQTSLANLSDV